MQAEALVPLTERMLSGAGIRPGTRVLEPGCGGGDVTELIAKRVGSNESVVTMDRDPSQVAATNRLRSAGHHNVEFVVTEMADFRPTGLLDAIVMLDARIHPDMAARLPSILSHCGEVTAEVSAPNQFGASSVELPLEALRSVVPTAHKLGRPDADQHDVDELLAAETRGRDSHTVTVPPLSVAAWVRI